MKRVFVSCLMVVLLVLSAGAQEYWHMKLAPWGVMALPRDGNGSGWGTGLGIMFGYPEGRYAVGFDVSKWWRTYKVTDSFMDSLSNAGLLREKGLAGGALIDQDKARHDESGLSLLTVFRYRFLDVSAVSFYGGGGLGFCFIQSRREEARQNSRTGYWFVAKADHYLETKAEGTIFLGLAYPLGPVDLVGEGRATFIPDWNRWDKTPEILSARLGFCYNF